MSSRISIRTTVFLHFLYIQYFLAPSFCFTAKFKPCLQGLIGTSRDKSIRETHWGQQDVVLWRNLSREQTAVWSDVIQRGNAWAILSVRKGDLMLRWRDWLVTIGGWNEKVCSVQEQLRPLSPNNLAVARGWERHVWASESSRAVSMIC